MWASGSYYALTHAAFTAAVALLYYLLFYQSSLSWRKLSFFSILLGLIGSFFLNISINFLPILLYTGLAIFLFSLTSSRLSFTKTVLSLGIAALLALLINLPMVVSLFRQGNTRTFTTFQSLSLRDALTAGTANGKGDPFLSILVYGFLPLLLFLLSDLSRRRKYFFILLFFFIAWLLLGKNAPLNLYGMVFNHIPLMDSLTSLHRLLYFELLIYFIAFYSGLSFLLRRHVTIFLFPSIAIVGFIVFHLLDPKIAIFHSGIMPDSYFQAYSYLNTFSDSKIYFPAYWSDTRPSLTQNYTWLNEPALHTTIYTNPYSSIFALKNFTHFGSSNLDLDRKQIRDLIDYTHPPEDIISALQYLGIRYLIVDRNYFWDQNFPNFNIDRLTTNLQIDHQFGNLFIYHLSDRSAECIPSYGDYRLGYCFTAQNPRYLINTTPQNYFLDQLALTSSGYAIPFGKDKSLPKYVVNVNLWYLVKARGFLLPYEIYTADNNIPDLFSKSITPGKYYVFIPLLKLNPTEKLFGSQSLSLKIDGQVIQTISPYSLKEGFTWEEIPLSVAKTSVLTIDTNNLGTAIISRPLLIPASDWSTLKTQIRYIPSAP